MSAMDENIYNSADSDETQDKKKKNREAQQKHREKRKNAEKENAELRKRVAELEQQVRDMHFQLSNSKCGCRFQQNNFAGGNNALTSAQLHQLQYAQSSSHSVLQYSPAPSPNDMESHSSSYHPHPLQLTPPPSSYPHTMTSSSYGDLSGISNNDAHSNFLHPHQRAQRARSFSSNASSNFDDNYVPNYLANGISANPPPMDFVAEAPFIQQNGNFGEALHIEELSVNFNNYAHGGENEFDAQNMAEEFEDLTTPRARTSNNA